MRLCHHSAITDDGARLDIALYGFWGGRFEKAFLVFNPSTQLNQCGPLDDMDKKSVYGKWNMQPSHVINRGKGIYLLSQFDLELVKCTVNWS